MFRTMIVVGALLMVSAGAGASVEAVEAEDVSPGEGLLDHPGGASERNECRATTPQVVCTTGAHTRGGFTVSHGFTGMIGSTYTGTAESTLQWVTQAGANGARNFACTYQNGVIRSCLGSGAFPPVGAVFVQLCKSYDAGTTTPGGSGDWGCYLTHN